MELYITQGNGTGTLIIHHYNDFRPHVLGIQQYLPPPPAPSQEENAIGSSSECPDAGEGSP